MRKLLSLTLALVMVFSLAACGTGGGSPTEQPSPSGEPNDEKPKVIYIGGSLGDAGIADATYRATRE